jgi:hemolysin D
MRKPPSSDFPVSTPDDRVESLSIDTYPETLTLEFIDLDEASQVYGGAVALDRRPLVDDTRDRLANLFKQPETEWSPSLQEVLDQPPSTLPLRLAAAGLLFCSAFSAWAWVGRIQEVSNAPGKLIPKGEVFKVQPVSQGEISRVFVKEGQTVKAGQIIAELDNRLILTEIDRLEQSLNAQRIQLGQTMSTVERSRQELVTRQAISSAAAQAQKASILQAIAQADTYRETLGKLQTESAAFQERVARFQPLVAEGAISREQSFTAEQANREQERLLIEKQGEIQRSEGLAKQLQAELDQKLAEGQQSELETRQQVQKLEAEAAQIRGKMAETETLLKAEKTKLGMLALRAPVDGVVSALKVNNPGEVAQPGQTVAEILPEGMPLVMTAVLPNEQAGFVKLGMPVQIKFDAFPYQTYGAIQGKVTRVAANAELDQRLGEVYRVEIELDQQSMQAALQKQQVNLRAGQTATADIVTRDRRIADVLLDPIRKVQQGGLKL